MSNFTLSKNEKTITVYTLPDGFFVEVDRGAETTEFYIGHKDYGVKAEMFEVMSKDIASEEELIFANAEEHMASYRDEYMD